MKRTISLAKVILGSLIIGLTINLFFVNQNLISSGIYGFSQLYAFNTEYDLAVVMILANSFFLILGALLFSKDYLYKSVITFWLVPLFVFLTKNVSMYIDITSADKFLIAIYGGVLMGIGYRFIYRENMLVSATDSIKIIEKTTTYNSETVLINSLNILLIILAYFTFGLNSALLSLISIVIMENISKRLTLGINQSKVFYIITEKEKEVKKFIIEDLKYDLTVLEVRGGFTNNKRKVLMSVIPSEDYYKLKEGIRHIDQKAFISITDSYETINESKRMKH